MNIIFRIRLTTLIGSTIIIILIRDIKFYIINTNTLFLLSSSNIDSKGIMLNNLINKLIYIKEGKTILVI